MSSTERFMVLVSRITNDIQDLHPWFSVSSLQFFIETWDNFWIPWCHLGLFSGEYESIWKTLLNVNVRVILKSNLSKARAFGTIDRAGVHCKLFDFEGTVPIPYRPFKACSHRTSVVLVKFECTLGNTAVRVTMFNKLECVRRGKVVVEIGYSVGICSGCLTKYLISIWSH